MFKINVLNLIKYGENSKGYKLIKIRNNVNRYKGCKRI